MTTFAIHDRVRFIPASDRKRDQVRADDPFGTVIGMHDGGGRVPPYLIVLTYRDGKAYAPTVPVDRAEPL